MKNIDLDWDLSELKEADSFSLTDTIFLVWFIMGILVIYTYKIS